MVGSALTLALIGLGAVSSALPTGDNAVKERQTFGLGPGGSTFGTGSGQGVQCDPTVPLTEQPPCILTVIGGTFTPPKAKRSELNAPSCPAELQDHLDDVELDYEALLHQDHLSWQDKAKKSYLANALLGCGITIVKSPDGTSTTIKPSDKRSASAVSSCPAELQDHLDDLELDYEALLHQDHLSWQDKAKKSYLANALLGCGITIVKSPDGTSTTIKPSDKMAKRQTPTIGKKACEMADLIGLKAALDVLEAFYGDAAKAPAEVFRAEQLIVSYLTICNQTVAGWTTLTPGNPLPGGPIPPDPTIPGGPITPDPAVPGGAITPDPTTPGGSIHPSDRRRQAPISDPSALLAALELLEKTYGGYGSGTIPVPVFLIMQNIVTILQDIPGVVVPGWPILGAGSTGGIHPSD